MPFLHKWIAAHEPLAMTSALVVALSCAGFGLLVFGERMGLGAQLAAWGVAGIFILATIVLALSSMTSRLPRFLAGAERGASLGLAASVACLLLPGATAGVDFASATIALGGGFLAAALLAPFNPWRQREGAGLVGQGGDRDPGQDSRGALAVFMVAVTIAAGAIALDRFPVALDRLVEATGWPRALARTSSLGLVALVALLGGLHGLARAARVLIIIALVTAVVPFMLFFAGEFLDQFNAAFLRQLAEGGLESGRAALKTLSPRAEWPAFALGFALGLIGLQPAAAVRSTTGRGFAILAGMLVALLLGALASAGQWLLDDLVTQRIAGAAPLQWPLFVFDETLRGWLTACGAAPEDAQAAARACASGHPRNLLPAGSLRFDRELGAPALSLAQGWPIILGYIWGLLVPFFGLLAVGLLAHAAATGFSERVLFRTFNPAALRAWRLAMARLSLIAGMVGLYVADSLDVRLDPAMFRWMLAGSMGLAFTAVLASRMIALIRFFRARRAVRALPAPAGAAAEPT